MAAALAGGNGQSLPGAPEVTPRRPCIAVPTRAEELQQLLGASIDENGHLTAHVRRLEAELRRSSAELAEVRRQLRGAVHDALTDPLTGLANRRSFDLELGAVAARAGRTSPAHLVMADIDHFKRVNDTHGHDIGDEVLRIIGGVLLANVRRDSLVARVGGDEFGLLLPRASPHYTAGIASRLCELLASRPLVVRGHPRLSSGSRCRSGWPLGMRAKAVPDGLHGPTRRSTRRSDAAATGSRSTAASRPPPRPCLQSRPQRHCTAQLIEVSVARQSGGYRWLVDNPSLLRCHVQGNAERSGCRVGPARGRPDTVQRKAPAADDMVTAIQETIEHADRGARARRPAVGNARDWVKTLAPYREPSLGRSLTELAVTAVPFVALWLLMLLSLRYSYWLCLLLAVPAAGFVVRLFMIQHDCGHGSFFRRRCANDWLGRVIGVLTLTPYGYWRRTHAMHHATSGHLDRRGTGDVDTLTVREYQSLPIWRRARYRLKRHPLVLLGLGPFYLFVLSHRLPLQLMRAGRDPWVSVMSTNLAIVAVVGLLMAALAGC